MGADKVMETNDEVMAEVIAVKEGEPVELTEQQEADIARTTNECDLKLKEVGELLRDMLWQKFGDELCTAVELAEAECERVARVRPDGNHEAYEFMLSHLKSLVGTAKEAHCKWQQWVPVEDQKEFGNGKQPVWFPERLSSSWRDDRKTQGQDQQILPVIPSLPQPLG